MTTTKKLGLIPNISYNEFILGARITEYLSKKYRKETFTEESFTNDCYHFYKEKIDVWCDLNGCINTIRCWSSCFYNGKDLINMNIQDFITLIQRNPDSQDSVYLIVNGKGQTQHVYEFENLGLQILVWRKKIKTIMIYSSISKTEQE